MSESVRMVVVDGVRYRPEDAPKKAEKAKPDVEAKEAEKPANKARTARNK